MGIREITSRESVIKAIEIVNQLGEEEFLKRYGYGPARQFFLEYKGKFYPSKAIIGVAYGFQFPNKGPLKSADFVGGIAVQKVLNRLGFFVHVKK